MAFTDPSMIYGLGRRGAGPQLDYYPANAGGLSTNQISYYPANAVGNNAPISYYPANAVESPSRLGAYPPAQTPALPSPLAQNGQVLGAPQPSIEDFGEMVKLPYYTDPRINPRLQERQQALGVNASQPDAGQIRAMQLLGGASKFRQGSDGSMVPIDNTLPAGSWLRGASPTGMLQYEQSLGRRPGDDPGIITRRRITDVPPSAVGLGGSRPGFDAPDDPSDPPALGYGSVGTLRVRGNDMPLVSPDAVADSTSYVDDRGDMYESREGANKGNRKARRDRRKQAMDAAMADPRVVAAKVDASTALEATRIKSQGDANADVQEKTDRKVRERQTREWQALSDDIDAARREEQNWAEKIAKAEPWDDPASIAQWEEAYAASRQKTEGLLQRRKSFIFGMGTQPEETEGTKAATQAIPKSYTDEAAAVGLGEAMARALWEQMTLEEKAYYGAN